MAEARLRQDILFPAGASLGISVDEALKVRRVNDPDSRAIKAARKGLREAELTDAQKARRDAKAARAKERRRAQAKARNIQFHAIAVDAGGPSGSGTQVACATGGGTTADGTVVLQAAVLA